MFKHLHNNKGDANVSKMTLIALVFVVGAILLVLVTSAFRNPINRWFDKVQASWFADENGIYEADNPFVGYQRNKNGTYQGLQYIYHTNDGYFVLKNIAELDSSNQFVWVAYDKYDNSGKQISSGGTSISGFLLKISEDGSTVSDGRRTYVAQLP